jgi:DNA replication protein DnaC
LQASEGTAARIMAAGSACSLTKAVLAEWATAGTPKQVEYLAEYLEAERASRDASKRASLMRRCAVPSPKTFDGYDWTAVSWPDGFGRDDLLSLSFLEGREDLVLMGDVGTGKTHMASALCALACSRKLEARFFTASSLVMRLRRARDDGRLDAEMARIGRARLLVIDELGFLPLEEDGARLLFQVVSESYERQSVVFTTNLEFSRWGAVFGDAQMAAAVIDRVVHHGRLLQFRGESYRVRHALMGGGAQKASSDPVR